MGLTAQVKLKNNQLLGREILLRTILEKKINMQSKDAHLLSFIVAPFCAGFIVQRLAGKQSGAKAASMFLPFGSLVLKNLIDISLLFNKSNY